MFNLDKIQNKKHEMDSGFDYIPAEKKKKIIDELTLYKKDKIYFNKITDKKEKTKTEKNQYFHFKILMNLFQKYLMDQIYVNCYNKREN